MCNVFLMASLLCRARLLSGHSRRWFSNFSFVPKHEECSESSVAALQQFVTGHERLFVLTGAGISTESGIPDYRSEGVGLYATSVKRPVQIQVK